MCIMNLWSICREVLYLTIKKKMGRPTDNPKPHIIKTRLDDNTLKTLKDYCEKHNKSQAEGVRDGISRLRDDLK